MSIKNIIIKPLAWIWNKTLGWRVNYFIMENSNKRYCVFRFWIDPKKPTWELKYKL